MRRTKFCDFVGDWIMGRTDFRGTKEFRGTNFYGSLLLLPLWTVSHWQRVLLGSLPLSIWEAHKNLYSVFAVYLEFLGYIESDFHLCTYQFTCFFLYLDILLREVPRLDPTAWLLPGVIIFHIILWWWLRDGQPALSSKLLPFNFILYQIGCCAYLTYKNCNRNLWSRSIKRCTGRNYVCWRLTCLN